MKHLLAYTYPWRRRSSQKPITCISIPHAVLTVLEKERYLLHHIINTCRGSYMTTGKTIALTRWTFVGKVMSLLFNRLSRFVIAFLPRSSVQFSSVAQSCPTLCDPMNHSTPVLPVQHQLPESTQAHVH